MFSLIRSDITRKLSGYTYNVPKNQLFLMRIKLLLEFSTLAVVVYRYGHWVYHLKIPIIRQLLFLFYWVLNVCMMAISGIWIHHSCRIGKGFVVHNFSGIFIIADTMGENCTVNQGVNCGGIRGSKRPRIGNNVYFGAGCKVLGDFTVGDNVVIAANSVVFTSIPDESTVLGIPAKIMARGLKSKYREIN